MTVTNVVVSAAPFHRTASLETKLLPFTVSVNPGPPEAALAGTIVLNAGTGGGGGDTFKVTLMMMGEPCTPEAVTVTCPV